MPLAIEIEKIGEAQITGAARSFDLAVFAGRRSSIALAPAELDFVRGHFWKTSEAERLRAPDIRAPQERLRDRVRRQRWSWTRPARSTSSTATSSSSSATRRSPARRPLCLHAGRARCGRRVDGFASSAPHGAARRGRARCRRRRRRADRRRQPTFASARGSGPSRAQAFYVAQHAGAAHRAAQAQSGGRRLPAGAARLTYGCSSLCSRTRAPQLAAVARPPVAGGARRPARVRRRDSCRPACRCRASRASTSAPSCSARATSSGSIRG